MPFLKRNYREIVWVLINAAAAVFNLLVASTATAIPAEGLHAIFFGVHVALIGYWVWAIFDNADYDALEQQLRDAWAFRSYPQGTTLYGPQSGGGQAQMQTRGYLNTEEEIRRRLNDGDGS